MVDPSTDKDSEVHEGCREIWSTQGVQEADPKEGNDVFKIVQVGSVREDDIMSFKISENAWILPSLPKQNTVLMNVWVRLYWVGVKVS